MNEIMYTPERGQNMRVCALKMYELSKINSCEVTAEINGVRFKAKPESTYQEIVNDWYRESNKKRNEPHSVWWEWRETKSAIKRLWKSILYYKMGGKK
jgi:uncharacterized protein YcaQ